MLQNIPEPLPAVAFHIQRLRSPNRIQVIPAALLKLLPHQLPGKNHLIQKILILRQRPEIRLPLRQLVALAGIQAPVHRRQVPQLIIGDIRPGNEMIQVKLLPRQQLPRVDIPDGPVADLRHRLPQPAGIVQLPGAGLMLLQLVNDAGHPRIAILQETHLLQPDPAADHRIIIQHQLPPVGIDANLLLQPRAIDDDIRQRMACSRKFSDFPRIVGPRCK